jgi:two-component system, LytTR family, response regulator
MNCIIIDDEPLAREGMQMHVERMPQLKLTGSFSNPFEAMGLLQQNKTDLVFLDVNMPEISGLDFAKSLTHSPMIIFVTAYPQYALDSYELSAVDYLLKPVRFERFVKAVNKAQAYAELLQAKDTADNLVESINDEFIYIKADRKYFKIMLNNILYIEGLKDYIIIHTQEKKIITAINLKTIFEQLPGKSFARISKFYIVNTNHIKSCDPFSINVNNTELPIGNSFKDDFFEKFLKPWFVAAKGPEKG